MSGLNSISIDPKAQMLLGQFFLQIPEIFVLLTVGFCQECIDIQDKM
jgi:hypothetical protein